MVDLALSVEGIPDSEVESLVHLLEADPDVSSVQAPPRLRSGFEPVTLVVVAGGAVLGAGLITRIADWYRSRSDCLLIVDARGPEIRLHQRCDLDGYRGKTIIVSDSQTQVVIHRDEGAVDLGAALGALQNGCSLTDALGPLLESGVAELKAIEPGEPPL